MEHDEDRELTDPRRRTFAVELDMSSLVLTWNAICDELERLSAHALRPEVAERLVEIVKAACHGVESRLVECEDGAAAAADFRVALEPTERLGRLLAALRAWDGNGDFVFDEGHAGERTDGSGEGEA